MFNLIYLLSEGWNDVFVKLLASHFPFRLDRLLVMGYLNYKARSEYLFLFSKSPKKTLILVLLTKYTCY